MNLPNISSGLPRNCGLLLRLPVGRGGVINSPRSIFLAFFSVSKVGLPLMGYTAVQYTDCYTRKNEQLDAMLSTTCCNVVLHTVEQFCAAPCPQLLLTTIVHSCSRSTTIVQSLLTTINKLFSSTIVSSCSNNIATTIVLCQHRTTFDRTILINIFNSTSVVEPR